MINHVEFDNRFSDYVMHFRYLKLNALLKF